MKKRNQLAMGKKAARFKECSRGRFRKQVNKQLCSSRFTLTVIIVCVCGGGQGRANHYYLNCCVRRTPFSSWSDLYRLLVTFCSNQSLSTLHSIEAITTFNCPLRPIYGRLIDDSARKISRTSRSPSSLCIHRISSESN